MFYAHSTSMLFWACSLAASVRGERLCSVDGCIGGKSSSNILHTDTKSHTRFTPGTYRLEQEPDLSQTTFALSLNQSAFRSGDTITLAYPSLPVAFAGSGYRGQVDALSGLSWTAERWDSLYAPHDWYAVVGGGEVLWGPIPDVSQLPPNAPTRISKASSSACDPPCSANGICLSSNSSATCQCRPGWAGAQCDQCAPGHFGSACQSCRGDCTVCDEGLRGTGACLGTAKDATACGCTHGTCSPSGDCTCSAGYTTSATISNKKCNTCVVGFFQTASGDCRSCPLGCTTCQLKAGTMDTAACTSCRTGLELNTADAVRCVGKERCEDGRYWEASSSTCQSCSPACTSCSGPSAGDCLTCAAPRMNLEGECVGVDSRGVCDSSLASVQGVFVANNGLGKCDACPAGCASCHIPSFSSFAAFASLQCSACADAYLLEEGRCVRQCSAGWFLPPGSAERNGTCQRCSSSCAECQSSPNQCTRCPAPTSGSPPLFALAGSCGPSCPSGTSGTNGTCTPCHPDCSSCTSPSISSCSACPPHLPVLRNGRCLAYCPRSSFLDQTGKTCHACHWRCGSCLGAGEEQCTTCADGYVLRRGKCEIAKCGTGGFVHGAEVCLEELLDHEQKTWVAGVIMPILAVLSGLGGWSYVRKQRRQRKEASRAFAVGLLNGRPAERADAGTSKANAGNTTWGRLLGVKRIWSGQSKTSTAPQGWTWKFTFGATDPRSGPSQAEKNRLRRLLLPSRGRDRQPAGADIELSPSTKHQEHLDSAASGSRPLSTVAGHWSIPPPPYCPPTAASPPCSPPTTPVLNVDPSTPDPAARTPPQTGSTVPSETRDKLIRTIKQYEDDIDLLSEFQPTPGTLFGTLRPPPIAARSSWSGDQDDQETQVYRPQVTEQDKRGAEDRLSSLWPNLREGRDREPKEGWV